mmetsp:Transcript_50612/g.120335  ORF Transcript_50612/g.120335 Transcript_50612/m.120335 type:complete len:214 (+) Transcript_50612:790-1431(+)
MHSVEPQRPKTERQLGDELAGRTDLRVAAVPGQQRHGNPHSNSTDSQSWAGSCDRNQRQHGFKLPRSRSKLQRLSNRIALARSERHEAVSVSAAWGRRHTHGQQRRQRCDHRQRAHSLGWAHVRQAFGRPDGPRRAGPSEGSGRQARGGQQLEILGGLGRWLRQEAAGRRLERQRRRRKAVRASRKHIRQLVRCSHHSQQCSGRAHWQGRPQH